MASRPPSARPSTVKTQKTKPLSAGPRRAKGKQAAASGPRTRRWFLLVWLVLVLWLSVEYARLPDVAPLLRENPRSTSLMAERAEEAREANRKPRQRQAWVSLGAVAHHAVAAVLLSEDARFYQHAGVDWAEVKNALGDALEKGRLGRGASTLTQQLAKNLYLSTDRSLLRKGKELLLARRLEAALPKQRILALYLNVVEWGQGVYGIEAAAREHFGTSARELTVAQGAMLAGMLPAPRRWLPVRKPAALHKRAWSIIERLEQGRSITPAEASEARAELTRFFGGPPPPPALAPGIQFANRATP